MEDEQRLPGGNVGGAVRVGDTVRRAVGAWTPAVHALLGYLDGRLPHVPRVVGFDDRGREILTYLPGRVIEPEPGALTTGQLTAIVRWTRALHQAVREFEHPGPWRYFPVAGATLIGHNDIAPYNVCFDGDDVVGVFDWDMAGPTTPLYELAFIAWNCVPLWTDIGARAAAASLTMIAEAYGDGFTPAQILAAVPPRIQLMLDGIPRAAAAGDAGMVNLLAVGEPERSQVALDALVARLPAIAQAL